jgi:hypothetical protein
MTMLFLSSVSSLSSPPVSPPADPVPTGYIRLILIHNNDSPFYLQIPLNIIASLCLTPRKYLIYLGWCILGIDGSLALDHDGEGIGEDGGLEDQAIYYYVPPEGSSRRYICVHCSDIALTPKHRFRPSCRP